MLEVERRRTILKEIKENGIVRVSDLSELFGVSQNAIRRDLQKLEEEGLTNSNPFEVQVKKAIIKAAREVILVVTHNKFGVKALAPVTPITAVHKIITDDGLSQSEINTFRQRGIETILA